MGIQQEEAAMLLVFLSCIGSTSSKTEDTEQPKIDEKPTSTPLGNRPMTRRRSASLDIDVTATAEVIPTRSAAKGRKSVPSSEVPSEPATTGGTPVKKAPVTSKVAVFDSIEETENESPSKLADAAAAAATTTTTTTNVPKRKKTDLDPNLSVINESLSEEQSSFKEDSPPKTIPDVRVSPRKSTPQKSQEAPVEAAATPRKKLFEEGNSVKESPKIATPKKTTPRVSPRKTASVTDDKVGSPKKLPFILEEESAKQGEIESDPKIAVDSQEKTSLGSQETTSVSPQENTSVGSQEKTALDSQEKTALDSQEKTALDSQEKTALDSQEKTALDSQENTSVGSQVEKTSVSPQRSSLRISLKKSLESPLKEATPQKTVPNSDDASPKTTSESTKGTSSPVVCWSPRKQLSTTSPKMADIACDSTTPVSDSLESSQTSDSIHFSLADTPNSSIISNKENITPEVSPCKAKTITENVFASKINASINQEPPEPMEVDETILETSTEVVQPDSQLSETTLRNLKAAEEINKQVSEMIHHGATPEVVAEETSTVPSDTPSVEVVQPESQLSATILHNLKAAEVINKQVSEMIEYGLKNEKFVTPEVVEEAKSSSETLDSVMESLSKVIKGSESTPKKSDSGSSPSLTTDKSPQADALKATALGTSPLARRDLTPLKNVEEKQAVVDISDDSSNAEEVAKEAVVDISDESSNVEMVDYSEAESSKDNKSPSKTINFSSDHMNVTGNTEEDKTNDDQDQGEVKSVDEDEPNQETFSDEEKASENIPSDEEVEADEKKTNQSKIIRVDLHRTEGYVKEVTDGESSNVEAVTGRDFIDDMAEVQTDPESEASHDSNEIEDIGEDIGFDDSEASSVGTYDDGDSFIDDQVVEELLSGDEYDLDQAKTKPRKSRIIPQDSDTEVITTKKRPARPIVSSSSNSERQAGFGDDEQSDRVETNAGTKVRMALSVEDLTGSSCDTQPPKKKKKKNRKKKNTLPAEIPTLSQSSTDDNKESLKRKRKTTAEKPATKKVKYEERRDAANDEDEQEESKVRRRRNKKKKSKKSKEVGKKVNEPNTLSIVNEALRRQKMNRNIAKSTVEWKITNVALKPFTSELEPPKIEAQASPAEEKTNFHPKDFKNQMLYDTKRVKRVKTSQMLKKRGG